MNNDNTNNESKVPVPPNKPESASASASVGGGSISSAGQEGVVPVPAVAVPAAANDGTVRRPVVGRRKDGRNYVQKNSLTESELLAAREQTRSSLKRKAKGELTEEDKREDRRAANRLSAFQSRQRRKMIIEDLQKTVAEQSKHNADQAKEIAELKRQLQAARQENELMRHQITGSAQGGFPGAPLFGGAAQIPGANPLLQLGQTPMSFQQQNQLLQNAMLQNALLFSAQAQQARGTQMNSGAQATSLSSNNNQVPNMSNQINAGVTDPKTNPNSVGQNQQAQLHQLQPIAPQQQQALQVPQPVPQQQIMEQQSQSVNDTCISPEASLNGPLNGPGQSVETNISNI